MPKNIEISDSQLEYAFSLANQMALEIRSDYYSARRRFYRAKLKTVRDDREKRKIIYKMNSALD